jgi:hypothetical protein
MLTCIVIEQNCVVALKCSRKCRQDVFWRSLGRVTSVSVVPKKCCVQEFTLCFFISINFHCLILERGYLQGHIKNSGTVMILQLNTICNVCVSACLDMYGV